MCKKNLFFRHTKICNFDYQKLIQRIFNSHFYVCNKKDQKINFSPIKITLVWENFFSNNIKWWAVVLKFFMSCIWGWLDLRNIAGQTILKSPGEKKSISRIFLRIFSHQKIFNSKYSVKLINLINLDFF